MKVFWRGKKKKFVLLSLNREQGRHISDFISLHSSRQMQTEIPP